jgi:anaphase-promoting complex subunit 8
MESPHALAGLAQKCIEIEKYRFETCIVVGRIILIICSIIYLILIGNFYSIRNDHARAIQYFTRALRMNPDYPAAWILLGHEFVEGKSHAAAINAYREALGKFANR